MYILVIITFSKLSEWDLLLWRQFWKEKSIQFVSKMCFTYPKLYANLFSVSKFMSNDLKIQFNINECIIKSCNGEAIAIVPRKWNFYEINFVKVHRAKTTNLVQSSTGDGILELWHRHLGHLNVKNVHTLQKIMSGMNLGKFSCSISSLFGEACIKGKQYRVAFPNEGGRRATKPSKIVHSNVWCLIRLTSMGSVRCYVSFTNKISRKMWLYMLESKGDCFEKFKEFKGLLEKQSKQKIKTIRSDNGG